MIQAITIRTDKEGRFSFTPDEFEEMKAMSQAELLKKIRSEFEYLTGDRALYVVNIIQAVILGSKD